MGVEPGTRCFGMAPVLRVGADPSPDGGPSPDGPSPDGPSPDDPWEKETEDFGGTFRPKRDTKRTIK